MSFFRPCHFVISRALTLRWYCILLAAAFQTLHFTATEACTASVFGRLATKDGSTYTASSTDCLNCDFRLAKVPARDHPPNATRPVFLYQEDYPHLVDRGRAASWHPSNLEGSPKQLRAWTETEPIGHIPQVSHTFALFEGGAGYGLLNEHGVSLGESTCSARFVANPVSHNGGALFDVSELSRVGLERGRTAREVIAIMGSLSETFGYYGAEWYDKETQHDEAGEALMVADRKETWVFHITPDDTGNSSVWAAQRVPDTDVTAVANLFIIRGVDKDDNGDNFMYSSNMFQVAARNGLWNEGEELDFSKTFGKLQNPPRSSYSNLRMWRFFTLANPMLQGKLDPAPNEWLDGYPFSVTPKKRLSRNDLFRIYRDHFEGTKFDLTKGKAGGPYGDPNRYDVAANGNMSAELAVQGSFGRPISMFRTSYTSISRSKGSLPPEIGSMLYFSQQQPSSSVFIPLYLALESVPKPFTRGSLFRYSEESFFWAVTGVSNWVHMYYLFALDTLRGVQKELEEYDVDVMDRKLMKLLVAGRKDEAMVEMSKFCDGLATQALTTYQKLLPQLIARFHDGFVVSDPNALRINMEGMFYPEWWLNDVGYFEATETGGNFGVTYPTEEYLRLKGIVARSNVWSWVSATFLTGAVFGAFCSVSIIGVGMIFFRKPPRQGYKRIP